ncbi:MAG: hypothetical protein FWB96_11800 [Defluviitaleaceae bacterium]|nr:hypothetical protein [Defluviitaleaceae bacterium]MCL2263771.1 hypothetical protein [Defluviitaleaceae bacterium]
MQAKICATIHNRFEFELIDAKTGEIKQRAKAENAILEPMWHRVCAGLQFLNTIHLGGGTNIIEEVQASGIPRARMDNFILARARVQVLPMFNAGFPIASGTHRITLHPDEFEGETFSQVGISFNGTATWNGAGNPPVNAWGLVTHALLEDSEGNPMSITKGRDILTVDATIFVHFTVSANSRLTNWDVLRESFMNESGEIENNLVGYLTGRADTLSAPRNIIAGTMNLTQSQHPISGVQAGANIGSVQCGRLANVSARTMQFGLVQDEEVTSAIFRIDQANGNNTRPGGIREFSLNNILNIGIPHHSFGGHEEASFLLSEMLPDPDALPGYSRFWRISQQIERTGSPGVFDTVPVMNIGNVSSVTGGGTYTVINEPRLEITGFTRDATVSVYVANTNADFFIGSTNAQNGVTRVEPNAAGQWGERRINIQGIAGILACDEAGKVLFSATQRLYVDTGHIEAHTQMNNVMLLPQSGRVVGVSGTDANSEIAVFSPADNFNTREILPLNVPLITAINNRPQSIPSTSQTMALSFTDDESEFVCAVNITNPQASTIIRYLLVDGVYVRQTQTSAIGRMLISLAISPDGLWISAITSDGVFVFKRNASGEFSPAENALNVPISEGVVFVMFSSDSRVLIFRISGTIIRYSLFNETWVRHGHNGEVASHGDLAIDRATFTRAMTRTGTNPQVPNLSITPNHSTLIAFDEPVHQSTELRANFFVNGMNKTDRHEIDVMATITFGEG